MILLALAVAAAQPSAAGPWDRYKKPNPFAKYAVPRAVIFGVGQVSCARAFAPDETFQTFAWVMGYFSGRNASEKLSVGHSTDGDGIVADIRMTCANDPTNTLFKVTDAEFNKLRDNGR